MDDAPRIETFRLPLAVLPQALDAARVQGHDYVAGFQDVSDESIAAAAVGDFDQCEQRVPLLKRIGKPGYVLHQAHAGRIDYLSSDQAALRGRADHRQCVVVIRAADERDRGPPVRSVQAQANRSDDGQRAFGSAQQLREIETGVVFRESRHVRDD